MQLIRANDFSARHASSDVLAATDFRDIGRIFHVAVRCIKLQKIRLFWCGNLHTLRIEKFSNFFFKFEVVRTTFARNCTSIFVILSMAINLCLFNAIEGSRQRSGSQRNLVKLGETDDRHKLEINQLKLET